MQVYWVICHKIVDTETCLPFQFRSSYSILFFFTNELWYRTCLCSELNSYGAISTPSNITEAVIFNLKTVHYITMTSYWTWWRLKSPASRLFTQPFIHAQIEENIKTPRHWPFGWKIHRSPHKGSVTRKMFPFDDVIVIRLTNQGNEYTPSGSQSSIVICSWWLSPVVLPKRVHADTPVC